ncbi:hypothetical protein [Acholeplasma granularum]|uniref:hypothetical protein n=1 Tax=Acholeplasma granularum TaxID=264635 RepID=UPI0004BC9DDF|nr:hypothetical protein [Acholeplasma granularum]
MIIKELLKIKLNSKRRYAFFIVLAALVVLGYAIYDLIFVNNDQTMIIFNWVIVALSASLGTFGTYITIGASLDLKDLKKDVLPMIEAKMVRYNKKGYSPKNPSEIIYTGQVFIDLNTNEEKMLIVSNVEPNKRYKIIYGKRTNIGIIVDKL